VRGSGGAVAGDGSFTIEVAAGEWSLRVVVDGHPELRVPRKALDAGELWNVGTLQLTVGGTLVVNEAAGDAQLSYLVFDGQERFVCGLYSPVPPLHSDLIAPGDYTLFVRGEGIAAQAIPFSIRSDETTELAVARPEGVRQQLVFVPAAGAENSTVRFEVRRDGKLVQRALARGDGGQLENTVWLAPGDYELAATDGDAHVAFTVATQEGAPVRLDVP
jgi:hypothetical protein